MPVFITFEGIDASGKSTQFELLTQYLRAQGRSFIAAREPGGTELGERLRELVLSARHRMTVHTEAFLFAAARAELVEQVIRPALAAGQSVILDRYIDSSIAYQAYGRGLPPEFVRSINDMAAGDLWPHRTILFDLPVPMALERKAGGDRDRLEQLDADFFDRVREGYLEMAAAEPRRIKVVDATASREQIHDQVRMLVEEIWPRRGG